LNSVTKLRLLRWKNGCGEKKTTAGAGGINGERYPRV